MRIFIDVGGHLGQTVESVIDPIYNFDLIYSLEPVKKCAEIIRRIKDKRVIVCESGLSNSNKNHIVYKPGSEGASIFNDHSALSKNYIIETAFNDEEECVFIRASDFFIRNIKNSDYVILKLNCEGSECDILLDLIESGEINKVNNLLIDFDAKKIPSQFHKIDLVLNKLNLLKIKYHLPEDVQYGGGSHFGGIRKWLWLTGEAKISLTTIIHSVHYHFKNISKRKQLPYYKLKILKFFPKQLTNFYYKFVKT